ncbi:hypothetical protein IJ556_00995, partial [bacterium]|nr:hypothetical protein [bacterium]
EAVTLALASANVTISDAIDKNITNASVEGDTNITTTENLNIHSTATSEMAAKLQTATVSGVSLSVLSNNVTENSEINALIKDVNGVITTEGLNIKADTDKLSVIAKTNGTTIAGYNATLTGSGANMTAKLNAGIDSLKQDESKKGLIVNNNGQTIITSGVKASDNEQAADISANAYIENNGFSLYSANGLDAKAVNDVKVNAILKADEHNANSLKMTAKVNELAKADVDSTSVKLVGIDVAVLDTDVKGSVGVNISGKNTIENKAEINADSDVTSDVSVSSASYGFATGSDTNLTSNINSNTVLNIGGELNAKEIEINSDTNKISKVDYSSSQGGGVSIGAATINNTVSGTSKVNLTDYQSSKDYDNNITIKNISTNTQDTVSSSSSGGGVSVSSASVSGSFGSSAEINVKNSDINAAGNLDFEVQNNNIVKDSASLTNGGVVAISTWDVSHTYGSSDKGAKITVDNSEISADNLDMKTFADTRNALGDGWVEYRGKSGGFWAEHTTTLTNTINQNSEIDVKNGSVLHADNNTTLIANTSSEFRQKIDSSGSGFVTIPKGQTTLNVNNTNKISIEAGSKVDSDNSTILNFDSDNTLYTRSYANSSHFAGDPTAKSYLNLVINNELQNNGVINAGNLIDINYMNNSQNELNQYARTVAEAAVATSTQDGKLSRTYNNSLNVAEGGLISSNKDVDINFGNGSEKLTSEISYKSVSRLAFGIPITATGNKENISRNGSSTLKLNGDIATGQGSNKYMKINSDGTVDTETLLGFASGNYSLSGDGTIDGEKLKAETLKLLNDKIKNLGSRIDSLNESIKEETKQISNLENQIKVNNDKLTEINNYTLKNIDEFNAVMDNDYKLLVRKALVNNGDVDGNNNVTVAYINIINDYKSYVLDMTENIPTITEFINSHDTYKNLTDTQKAIFQNNYDTVESKVTVSPKGNYTVYDSYMLSENVTITDGTAEGTSNITYANQKEYLTALNTTLTSYKNSYETSKTNEEVLISALTNEQTVLQNDYDTKKLQEANEFSEPYAIAFGDMASESSGINIAGITESNIKGSGNFKTAASALTIDNYSTRSLNFGAIDLASDTVSGLTISGKNYADYIGTDKVIGSETGVHYIVNGEGGNGDIKITNYYDNTNPFASSLENVPNNTTVSNITFQNRVKTGGNINIYNESGNITAQSGLSANKKIFTSVNGDVTIDNSDIDVTLKADDSIFAGGDVNIIANNADIKGDIKSGYTNRNLTITNDMLTNLVLDPTTGETNLINIEGTDNNIKAIYKDGEIYVFSLGNNGGKVNISANSGSVTSNVTAKDGYQTVSINNKTDKKLNVYNISNNNHSGGFTASDNLDVSND